MSTKCSYVMHERRSGYSIITSGNMFAPHLAQQDEPSNEWMTCCIIPPRLFILDDFVPLVERKFLPIGGLRKVGILCFCSVNTSNYAVKEIKLRSSF